MGTCAEIKRCCNHHDANTSHDEPQSEPVISQVSSTNNNNTTTNHLNPSNAHHSHYHNSNSKHITKHINNLHPHHRPRLSKIKLSLEVQVHHTQHI